VLLLELKDYSGRSSFFWWTFGFTINAAWLLIASYVQLSSLLVYFNAPMNILQLVFLGIVLVLVCLLSFLPFFRCPPAYFCVSCWTFAFQAILWSPRDGAEEVFSDGVMCAYRITVAVVAVLSLPLAVLMFYKKCKQESADSDPSCCSCCSCCCC